jgi:16S rRNA C1402 N4-methylase RsmH
MYTLMYRLNCARASFMQKLPAPSIATVYRNVRLLLLNGLSTVRCAMDNRGMAFRREHPMGMRPLGLTATTEGA